MAVDARGFPLARRGAGEMALGVGQAAKDWATTDTGATVVGVAAGIFAGEWIGSWVTEYFAVANGWNKILYKAVAKAGLSFAAFYFGRRMGGMGHILLNGVAAGSLASIIGDVIGEFVAPGVLGFGAGRTGRNIRPRGITVNPGLTNISQSNRNVGALGKTANVINSI